MLSTYGVKRLPKAGEARIAAFVGEESDPLNGKEITVDDRCVRTFTPWGQIALLAGGPAGYERIKASDLAGIVPDRAELKEAMSTGPLLIVIDELILYMARAFALPPEHQRSRLNSQWSTFFQVLFGIAAGRPNTVLLLTLPSEKDANRIFVGEMKPRLTAAWETVNESMQTAGRHVPCS